MLSARKAALIRDRIKIKNVGLHRHLLLILLLYDIA